MSEIKNKSNSIAILGTGSDVGKSIVATAFCRILSNNGKSVAPFKAQNMSNNSFVTKEGGEMGRAQVVQAEAARLEPHTDMNPVLLKPSADNCSQVVLHGRAIGNKLSSEYWSDTNFLFNKALESFERLQKNYKIIVIEGAGSCAEVNLRDRDFVNFRMAHAAKADVILVADIDRGGVFAQIIGTLNIIPPEDRNLVKGIIINKFRGDASLFKDGIKYIEEETGIPVLGLIPYFRNIEIDSEDGVILNSQVKSSKTFKNDFIKVGVFKLPHISNFTDISPLQRDSSVELVYLVNSEPLDSFDLIIIPGTKNARFDIEWLKNLGWKKHIKTYANNSGNIIGICGGFQMLGKAINDPLGMEGEIGSTAGFDLLDVETTLEKNKTLAQVEGEYLLTGDTIKGYEIHLGQTSVGNDCTQVIVTTKRNGEVIKHYDGAINKEKNIWGCYIHGLFDENNFRKAILRSIKPNSILSERKNNEPEINEFKNSQYDLLAKHYENNMDFNKVNSLLGFSK